MKQPLAPNKDFASSPVDVLELESNHFPSAKTQTGKQKKDGVVAATDRCAAVALKEQILAKMGTWDGTKTGRYRPEDPVLKFLKSL